MFWYTTLKITLSCSSNSNCRRFLRLQRLLNFLSRSGSRSETLKFSCTLQVDSGRHNRSPNWWSQQVATFHPSPDKEHIGEMFPMFCFIFKGIPWPPWDLRCPPHNCPARLTWCPRTRRSSGSTRFDQNSWTYIYLWCFPQCGLLSITYTSSCTCCLIWLATELLEGREIFVHTRTICPTP